MLHKLRRHWGTVGFLLLLVWFWEAAGGAALGMILFAAVVHEGGHLAALRLLRAPGTALRLSPLGAVIHAEDLRLSYPGELFAVLSGPCANILCGAVLTHLSRVYPPAASAAGAHWVLGIFNLLPAMPLDGWRGLQLLLCWMIGPAAGERIAGAAGVLAALLLSVGIVLLIIFSGGNLWLLPSAAGFLLNVCRSMAK